MSAPPPEPALTEPERPEGEPVIRTIAMPADTNPNGDIFGGWLMAQMDLAGGSAALRRASGRVATVAVDSMTFHHPVKVGDEVSIYARVLGIGRSSIRVFIEAWRRARTGGLQRVTSATFVYVAIGPDGRPRPVDPAP
ncbi:MAG: acyl-CoA thioesterase [Alphaproteobacteria bacterium]|nr:acyl-CoA thioesterase [Alphaproteobacteria bacterium]